MRIHIPFLLLLVVLPAYAEQFAAIGFSPLGPLSTASGCNLYVDVVEYPQPGKFYLQYRATSSEQPVKLQIGQLSTMLPAGADHRDGFGEVFGFGIQPEGESIELTFDGSRHCNGSPFSVRRFASKRAMEQLYTSIMGRKPTESEYVAWLDLAEPERRELALEVLSSPNRRQALIEGYIGQFIPSQSGVIDTISLAQSGKAIEEIIADFLSTETFYHVQGKGTNEGFLVAVYSQLLGYTLPVEEHRSLIQHLSEGTSLREVVEYLLRKPEFRLSMIQYWWGQHLKRPATDVEIREAIAALDRGWGWDKLQAGVIASDEYYKRSLLNK